MQTKTLTLAERAAEWGGWAAKRAAAGLPEAAGNAARLAVRFAVMALEEAKNERPECRCDDCGQPVTFGAWRCDACYEKEAAPAAAPALAQGLGVCDDCGAPTSHGWRQCDGCYEAESAVLAEREHLGTDDEDFDAEEL